MLNGKSSIWPERIYTFSFEASLRPLCNLEKLGVERSQPMELITGD